MKLNPAYIALAVQLQEAAGDLSAGAIQARLRDAIADKYRGTGQWAYYVDHFGDDVSGDVIYTCSDDTYRAPYEISDAGGAAKCLIDFEGAQDVVCRTIWEPEADEADHYAAMEEAALYQPGAAKIVERFVSKSEREKLGSEDFAGKGKSFPIAKPEDIMAAVHSMGRAGSGNLGPSGIKARIIAIAKRKGWEKYLPKAWQGDGAKESATPAADGALQLTECAEAAEAIVLTEARADYPVKLIAPGKGSSAFYPAEVLQRDGPKVFKAGTHMYINHATIQEEIARPEGDWKNLAAVLTEDARWDEGGAKGPGLYSRMKVFSDHGTAVEEKAPYTGVSIRAMGNAEMNAGKPVMREGVPVLRELTAASSVDVVTRAGAGGMILTESAGSESHEEADGMTEAEAKKLIEAAVAPFRERAIKGDARQEAARLLESVSLPAPAKQRIIDRAVAALPLTETGELNSNKFRELVVAEAKAEGEYLAQVAPAGRVFGMGSAPIVDIKTREAQAAEEKAEEADFADIFRSIGLEESAALSAAKGRVA